MVKKVISTDAAPTAIGPYSQGIIAEGFVFVSGQIPFDPKKGKMIEGGIAEQTEQCFKDRFNIL
jgi:2-iminobutanoate/2-iminopropanoate deaminase